MRLPSTAHTSRFWRIHEITDDFRLEDVWELPCRGAREDFPELVAMIVAQDVSRSSSGVVRGLFALRWKLGELLGWDESSSSGVGARVPTLRHRLPGDLRAAPRPEFAALPFASLYLLDDEFAAEAANRTMHGVMHVGWVPEADGGFRGHMAVLVKPNGLLGRTYMAAIRPFRHLIVYPTMMREWERAWHRRTARSAAAQV